MFVVFIIGLLLLMALFTIKAVELKHERRIFFARLRDRSDDRFAWALSQVKRRIASGYKGMRYSLARISRSTCRWISDSLHDAARRIHN